MSQQVQVDKGTIQGDSTVRCCPDGIRLWDLLSASPHLRWGAAVLVPMKKVAVLVFTTVASRDDIPFSMQARIILHLRPSSTTVSASELGSFDDGPVGVGIKRRVYRTPIHSSSCAIRRHHVLINAVNVGGANRGSGL